MPGDLNAIWETYESSFLYFVVYYLVFFTTDFVTHYFCPRIYHILFRNDECPCNQLANENNRPLCLRIFKHKFAVNVLFLVGSTLLILMYFAKVPLYYVFWYDVIAFGILCATIIGKLRKHKHKTTYKVLV